VDNPDDPQACATAAALDDAPAPHSCSQSVPLQPSATGPFLPSTEGLERDRRVQARDERKLILPVVLRGAETVPRQIRERQCFNLERFDRPPLSRGREFQRQIADFARYIRERCEAFRKIPSAFAHPESFHFPPDSELEARSARILSTSGSSFQPRASSCTAAIRTP